MIAFAPESSIVDSSGNPFKRDVARRQALADAFVKSENKKRQARRPVSASYDAAGSGDEHKNYWANADALDADSAHSKTVRETLVKRSRYEVANNGYAAGIASTYANDLVGLGPTLRMQTGSEGFNRMVERAWGDWQRAVRFRQKLWTMAHAKNVDGEGFGVLRRNARLNHEVKIDLVLHETEQFQTPYLHYGEPNRIDGIEFDDFGNPIFYDLMRAHPGASDYMWLDMDPERIPARFVMHWFRMMRPGQHRGVPECASTLNLGASARRWREATVAAAENIADFAMFIKTTIQPDLVDAVDPMSTLDIQKRMMTALPAGYDAFQPKAEQPTANHAEFHKSLINEQARSLSMPYNKAACDSSSYNYASGRLDHSTYYGSLDVDRQDCNDMVLDPLFDVWFELAVVAYGWLGGSPEAVGASARNHSWDWPKHQVADIKSEASANEVKLRTGATSLPKLYSAGGEDYEDELIDQAASNGVTVDQQRQINLLLNIPQHAVNHVASLLGIETNSTSENPQMSEATDAQEV